MSQDAPFTRYDCQIWIEDETGDYYAFPMSDDGRNGKLAPSIDLAKWTYKGLLPRGFPINDIEQDQTFPDKVRGKLGGGVPVWTGSWNIAGLPVGAASPVFKKAMKNLRDQGF